MGGRFLAADFPFFRLDLVRAAAGREFEERRKKMASVSHFLVTSSANLSPLEVLRGPTDTLLGVSPGTATALKKVEIDSVFDLASARIFANATLLVQWRSRVESCRRHRPERVPGAPEPLGLAADQVRRARREAGLMLLAVQEREE
ncbi:MAG: hypothetical protein JNN08_04375 [Bryobacterales bacterium]|nr:hypothetical protein [Bryobacterales bacterium]